MYEVEDVFQHIQDHKALIMVLGLITMISALVWYIESIRVARRDKMVAMPMMAVFGWLGHDTSYVLQFDRWFNTYDSWFFRGFWCFMVPLVIIEFIWIGQTLRYGRREFAPSLSPALWNLGVIATALAGAGAWVGLKYGLDDPLYIVSMHLTLALYAAGGIMLTLRRRSREGQSMLMWLACVTMFVTWSVTTIAFLGDSFHDWRWIVLCVTNSLWLIAGTVLYARMPRTAAAADSRQARVSEQAAIPVV